MGKYKTAMLKAACPRCGSKPGEECKPATSAIVHPPRRQAALEQGFWDPEAAIRGDYGDLGGEPLYAFKPKER